jgi:CHASE2 domain-containing sensor protein
MDVYPAGTPMKTPFGSINKPKRYWVFAIASIILGMGLGNWLEEKGTWIELRYRIYQGFAWLNPHPPKAKRTVVILIDDDEYWKGPLARRIPIRRDYLADLLLSLDKCDPAVIALDFNMRSPAADGSLLDNEDYTKETERFRTALSVISKSRPIVLPATIDISTKGRYTLDAAIYDGLPLKRGGIQIGYIQPPVDARLVPIAVNLAGGGTIDSFAESIARAVDQDLVEDIGDNDSLPFGTFMRAEEFSEIPAADIMKNKTETCAPLRHNIALVGAGWHQASYGRGELIDLHPSPLGKMSGVFLHANYVEAILDSRTYTPMGSDFRLLLELISSLVVAFLLAINMNKRKQTLAVAALCLMVMLLSYFFWQNLGIFFDFFFPTVFLLAHALVEYIRETRQHLKALEKRVKELEGQAAPA